MATLAGQCGELRATIQVVRKATGKVETFELVAKTTPEQHEKFMKELRKGNEHGCNS